MRYIINIVLERSLLIFITVLLAVPLYATELTINGTYLGGVNGIKPRNSRLKNQFDYAANVDINIAINPKVSGIIQFQMSLINLKGLKKFHEIFAP